MVNSSISRLPLTHIERKMRCGWEKGDIFLWLHFKISIILLYNTDFLKEDFKLKFIPIHFCSTLTIFMKKKCSYISYC